MALLVFVCMFSLNTMGILNDSVKGQTLVLLCFCFCMLCNVWICYWSSLSLYFVNSFACVSLSSMHMYRVWCVCTCTCARMRLMRLWRSVCMHVRMFCCVRDCVFARMYTCMVALKVYDHILYLLISMNTAEIIEWL